MFSGLKKGLKKVGGFALGGMLGGQLGMLGGMMGSKGGGGGQAAPTYQQKLPELQRHTQADQSTYDALNKARARFGGSAIQRPADYVAPAEAAAQPSVIPKTQQAQGLMGLGGAMKSRFFGTRYRKNPMRGLGTIKGNI